MTNVSSKKKFRLSTLGLFVAFSCGTSLSALASSDSIQFNTDVLDVSDRSNVDLSKFSRAGYIMPGTYNMIIHVNRSQLDDTQVTFRVPENDPDGSVPCLTPDIVSRLGLKEKVLSGLQWEDGGRCLIVSSLDGMDARADLGASALYLSIPQAYLEYTADNWDPPSRWDDGLPGVLFDYNFNAQARQNSNSADTYSLSGNGTTGFNLGAWRFRADWQSRLTRTAGSASDSGFDWSRYYAYRALPSLRSTLTLGEDYLSSDLFDSLRFTGASLRSDDNMLPPNLRGYAPEVSGVAKTNAKVTVTQQGRVLYETQVAAGPFRIQDLSDAVSGELDVRVEEQDGSVQTFSVNTASIPYLTRPGQVRYKLSAGQPSDWRHRAYGPVFGTGEFSWGVSNGWSLYGGGVAGEDYSSVAIGSGRDLMALGALSFDITQSHATLPEEGTLSGRSYRVSYSKNFDRYDSQVTFAGYRFSQKDYLSLSEFMDAREGTDRTGKNKEMYTVTLNKHFRDWRLSAYLNYDHKTYWDRPDNDRYSLTLSQYFDLGDFRNLSLSAQAYRTRYYGANDDGFYLTLSMPWGNRGTVSYNASSAGGNVSQSAGYYDRLSERETWQAKIGTSRDRPMVSGYYNREGDVTRTSLSAAWLDGSYTSLGLTTQGGLTLTPEGGALHRSSGSGGTRMLIDTDGVAGVPVKGSGSAVRTNRFGKAVLSDVGSFFRTRASIDLNQLNDNAEATNSVVQATLTQGAIGYRRFSVIDGQKAMAAVRLADGSAPPFGARITNARRQETGIVSDEGSVYLSGIKAGETMTVSWNGSEQCDIHLPSALPQGMMTNALLLPCLPAKR